MKNCIWRTARQRALLPAVPLWADPADLVVPVLADLVAPVVPADLADPVVLVDLAVPAAVAVRQ